MKINTIDEALSRVKENGLKLKRVPSKLVTPEILIFAVTSDGLALEYVSQSSITDKLATIAVNSKRSGNWIYVPQMN